jgi:hypothetical protein
VYKPHSYLHLSLTCMIPHHFPSSSKLHVTFEKSEWLLIFCQPANTEIKYGALEGESCSYLQTHFNDWELKSKSKVWNALIDCRMFKSF